jgi:hypothetical protein
VTYMVGQRVRVSPRAHGGHHRTPGCVKGRTGVIERVHAEFTNPETRAYGADGTPAVRLYLVGFDQDALWDGYRGSRSDRLYADVFEHWLEAGE